MSSVKDIKVFLQKQLHEKRFLEDSVEAIEVIENLESAEKELTKRVAEVKKQLAPLEKELLDAKENINRAEDAAELIVAEANDKAYKRLQSVEAEAAKVTEKLDLEVEALKQDKEDILQSIAKYKFELDKITADTAEAKRKLEGLKAERKDLISKYS